MAEWSKAAVCKTAYRGFESHLNLISQNGAVEARMAHNHQVAGSSPASATNTDRTVIIKFKIRLVNLVTVCGFSIRLNDGFFYMGIKGNRGSKKNDVYTERSIIEILNKNFMASPKYVLNNLYVYNWESDFLAITKSWYTYEVEVKISVSDFNNDFKKSKKHQYLSFGKSKIVPNYFYYAVPEGMILPSDVPVYAGLIYIKGKNMYIVKAAPKINKDKMDLKIFGMLLMDKFYYNMKTWEKRARERADADPKKLKRQGAAKVISDIVEKSKNAFKESCSYSYYPFGDTCCPCCRKENQQKPGVKFVDCNMQCEKGKKFIDLLTKK